MPTLTHNDSPTDDDGLTQQAFIDGIARVIKDCTPPKGIAINGYWGTGKTSALLQLREALKTDQAAAIAPVWFEAWRYQHEAMPIVALLHEIRAAFSVWNQAVDKAKKITGITFLGILGAFDETIKAASGGIISPKLGDVSKHAADYEKERYRTQLASQDISNLLEEAIEKALGGNQKLVIFIDDLDRCHPEAALKLLEGIKVYLNLKNCVIVFAIDQRQIERALKKALAITDDSGDHQAREYLEKICQDIYHLPLPSQTDKADYLDKLLGDLELGQLGGSHRTEIKAVVEQFDCLPANPRKIKALANRLGVVLRHNEKSNSPFIREDSPPRVYQLLLATAIIYTFHRELNEQLEKNPDYIDTVIMYAQNYESVDEQLLEPMKGIKPSFAKDKKLPTNPSDSNVFRLHELFTELATVTKSELQPFLGI